MPILRPRAAWWQWLTVLSLDAPIVCLLWQGLLARAAGVTLSWSHRFVLGASVWLAYAADRWLEGWRLDTRNVRTQRHRFYQRQRWPVFAVWAGMFAMDVAVALATLDRGQLVRGLPLLGAVVAYLLSHQLVHRNSPGRAPKEMIVALLLAAGVAFFLVPLPLSSAHLIPLGAFALACFTNCALISSWEQDVDITQGQTSLALQSSRNAGLIKWLPWVATSVVLLACPWVASVPRLALACGAGSTLLLALVDSLEPRVGWAAARVLADVALMTPLVPLLWRS
jgi:hypothetical protein